MDDGNPDLTGLHYLDNAATTFPKPESVLSIAMRFCATACVNPGRSTYDLALEAEAMLHETRSMLCTLFNGPDLERLIFGHNATDALNLVLFGILGKGGHVVTTRLEHNSVLRPIYHCVDDRGADVTFVSCDGRGYVDPDDVRRSIREDTVLVVVNHGSNVIGTVQDVASIGRICGEMGVTFCIDAAQTAGMIPIDMEAMNIDIVAFTGHKSLLGVMGTGGLCVGTDVDIPLSRAGGTGVKSAQRRHLDEYPYRLEYGTPNMVGISSLQNGVRYIESRGGVTSIHREEMKLTRMLWEQLRAIEGVTLYCCQDGFEGERTPVIAFNIDGFDPSEAGTRLDVDFSVACRTGLHCAPLLHERMGTMPAGTVRFSIGPLTRTEDVQAGIEAVRSLAAEKRR